MQPVSTRALPEMGQGSCDFRRVHGLVLMCSAQHNICSSHPIHESDPCGPGGPRQLYTELQLGAQFITSILLPICPMLLLAGQHFPDPSLGLGLVLRGASESGGLLLGTLGDRWCWEHGHGLRELVWNSGMAPLPLSKGGVGSPEMIHGMAFSGMPSPP